MGRYGGAEAVWGVGSAAGVSLPERAAELLKAAGEQAHEDTSFVDSLTFEQLAAGLAAIDEPFDDETPIEQMRILAQGRVTRQTFEDIKSGRTWWSNPPRHQEPHVHMHMHMRAIVGL